MKIKCFILLMAIFCMAYLNTNANLSKDWISYFGTGNTRILGIESDSSSGHIYIVGTTSEKELGTPGVHQPVLNATSNNPLEHLDIFLAKFNTAGELIWFTYYGGSKIEINPGLALDKSGNVYISGYSQSTTGIASAGAFKTSTIQGADFIAKFSPQGQRLWATYYNERGNITPFYSPIAVDENNDVYMFGLTSNTTDIATPGTYQPVLHNPPDITNGKNAYLVKFNAGGQRSWGSYFGGGKEIWNKDMHIDQQNNIYITGTTVSKTNIASPGAMVPQAQLMVNGTSYLAKFNPNGQRVWSTYIHNKEVNTVTSIGTDALANVYLSGLTASDSGIATPGAWQATPSANGDFFLIKLNSSGQKVWGTYYGGANGETEIATLNGGFDVNITRNRIRLTNSANPDIYLSGYSFSITGIQKGCTLPVDSIEGAVLSKFDNNGQLLWGSKYDAAIFDFDLGANDSLYFVGNTTRDSLSSSNVYQPSKPSQVEAGIFGKFVEHYVCPASFTVNFDKVNDTLKAQAGYLNYQWFRNDTLLQNGPQNYYALTGYYKGVYKLKVLDPCNCNFNSDTLFVAHPTSLNNTTHNTLELSVAPNPATNKLNVQLSTSAKGEFQFRIYNILGRKVFETTSKLDTDNKKTIDLSNYSPGLYILNVENREGKANVKFIRH